MKKTMIVIGLALLCVSQLSAQVQWGLSLNYHFESEETAYFDPPDRFSGLGSAIALRGSAEFPWGEHFIGGPYLQIIPSMEVYRFDVSPIVFELGLMIGPRFPVSNHEIRVTGQIGYRKVSSDSDFVDSDGLATNLNIEFLFNRENSISPKVALGFLAQPTGGNDEVFFSFSPYWYIGGGVVIKK